MAAAFLLAGVPVYRLTRPAAIAFVASTGVAVDNPTDKTEAKPAPLQLEVLFAPAATDFQLKNLDRTVLAGRGPQSWFTGTWTTSVPSEGVDLVVQAHWSAPMTGSSRTAAPVANPAAARVTVRFPDGRQAEKSLWAGANGALEDVFTVPGAPATPAPRPLLFPCPRTACSSRT